MHADRRAACRAGPLFLFLRDEFPDAERADRFEVREHAHAVLRPVAQVELPQPAAGEGRALAAEPVRLALLRAFLDAAMPAVGGQEFAAPVVAARTPVLFAQMPDAQGAIHPARSDHPDLDGLDGSGEVRAEGAFHAVTVGRRLRSRTGGSRPGSIWTAGKSVHARSVAMPGILADPAETDSRFFDGIHRIHRREPDGRNKSRGEPIHG